LGKAINDGQSPRGSIGHPQVLQVKEGAYVKHATSIPTQSSKFTSTADNLEDFLLDFPLKFGIKFVPERIGEEDGSFSVSSYLDKLKMKRI